MGKAVATTEKPGALAEIPDWMKGGAREGIVGVEQGDVAIPRVALLQALSPQVSGGEGRPGEFYHLLVEENLGKTLSITPILITKSFLLWRPRESGGGLLARADDGIHWEPPSAQFSVKISGQDVIWKTAPTVKGSGLDNWGSGNPADPQSLPAATKLLNVLVWLHDFPHLSPSVMSLQRSALKPGKKFVGKLMMSSAKIYGMKFNLGSEKVVGPKGEYMSPTFTAAGFIQEKGTFDHLAELCSHFTRSGVRVQETGLDAEAETEGHTGGDKNFEI